MLDAVDQMSPGPIREPLPLTVDALCLSLAGSTLIDRLSLRIEHPGVSVIMGQNGAGKSLLLRLLHGLIQPTSGEILWAGQPLNDSTRKRQAMVFQRPVMMRRSVAANIDFAISLRRNEFANRDERVARRDALLDEVGLLPMSAQPARVLSGGEQQRLSLARALAHSPQLLLLDEVTASLDPGSTAMIERIIAKRAETGTKVMFVSHDIGQARRVADEVVFLHAGQVVEHDVAQHVLDSPSSPQAQAYLEGRLLF